MNNAVEIRPIKPTDSIEELTRLLNAAYAPLGDMGLNYTAVDQGVGTTEKRIKSGVCFLAFCDGKVVGTIVVEPTRADPECPYFNLPHVASAHQFAVAPSHQRQGIGSSLLQHVEFWAQREGYKELALDTAEPAQHLIAMYERRGFTPVGLAQWKGKRYRSVIMTKALDTAP